MKLTVRSFIVLDCIDKFKGERSIYAIFHLLTGKKSSQTIFDGKLFHLSHLFSLLTTLTRSELEDLIIWFETNNLIRKIDDSKYIITEQGLRIHKDYQEAAPLPSSLDGWKYYDKGLVFWRRLSLLIQVISNLVNRKARYITIYQDEELLKFIKEYILHANVTREELGKQLFEECTAILESQSDADVLIFVSRLTSHYRIGYTFEQLAQINNSDLTKVYIQFQGVLHAFLSKINSEKKRYPFLYELIKDLFEKEALTTSSAETFRLLNEGKSIQEIASIRGLKQNTIEDHIVEIAQNVNSFTISPFVLHDDEQQVLRVQQSLNTKKIKQLKEHLDSHITYFQIRLVLAKSGDRHGT